MARRFETQYRTKTGDNLGDPTHWNRRFEDIDRRVDANEQALDDVDAVANRVESVALKRIDNVVTPIVEETIERVRSIAELFRAESVTSLEVGTGAKTLTVIDGQRDTFAITEWVAVYSIDDAAVGMIGRVTSYDPDTGVLAIDAATASGNGTYDRWAISVSAPIDVDHATRTDNPHGVTPAQIGTLTSAQISTLIAAVETGVADQYLSKAGNLSGIADAAAARTALGLDAAIKDTAAYFSKAFGLSGAISPPQLTANQDDWNPSGLSGATCIRGDTDASQTITGLQGGAEGRLLTIVNIGSNDLVLAHQSASSTAANRFRFASATDFTLAAGHSMSLRYDDIIDRWRRIEDASTIAAPGTIIQVVQTHLTTTSRQALPAGTRANIIGLNAAITPRDANSRIRITVRWSGEQSDDNNQDTLFGIRRNTTDIGNPSAAGSRHVGIAIICQGYWGADDAGTPDSAMYEYIDSPATTSDITYYATILSARNVTLYNQRTGTDTNVSFTERLTSTITLEEIAG